MPTNSDHQLYFVALVPTEPIFSKVMTLKHEVQSLFRSKAALNSPPHITLHMPFRYKESKEQVIIETLSRFCSKHKTLLISQNGFGSFEPRVIFINVEKSDSLNLLQSELLKTMRIELKTDSSNYKNQGFHPHMTIAFRDLKKAKYQESWEYYKNKTFTQTWSADAIQLLKHNGKYWEILQKFELL